MSTTPETTRPQAAAGATLNAALSSSARPPAPARSRPPRRSAGAAC